MSRTMFVYPATNPAAQFKYFAQLVAWCLRLIGQEADWDEYDDPGTVTTNMLVRLQNLGLQVSVAPGKLKQAHGEGVLQLLHALCREVLRRTGFTWQVPTYPDEGLADEADVDSDAEIGSVGEDEMADGDEDGDLMYQEKENKPADKGKDDESDGEGHGILETNLDPKEWLLEVERAGPKLKIEMKESGDEWRKHL